MMFLIFHPSFALNNSNYKEEETNSNNEGDMKFATRGAAAKIANSYLNDIVESFFASTSYDDPTHDIAGLKDEIEILANTDALKSFLVSVRRQLHRHPEVMYQESFTSQTIQKVLSELNIEYTTGWAKNTHQDVYKGQGGYGIVADIGTGQSPCIILRADMDALPIDEMTSDIDTFKSTERGKMHACGHDGHITMLLGAAAILKKMEGSLKGTVRLMFQPAEEGGAGAKRMVEEGVVTKDPKAELAFGMHVWPGLPSSTIASRPGTLMAAADTFEIVLTGKGTYFSFRLLNLQPM